MVEISNLLVTDFNANRLISFLCTLSIAGWWLNINPKYTATFVTQQFKFLLKVVFDCFPFYVHIPENYVVFVISAYCFTIP